MRGTATILSSAIALSALLLVAPRQGSSQTLGSPSTNPPPAAVKRTMPVSVFFGQREVLSVEEIRARASDLLLTKGYRMETNFHCVINITVSGKQAGCVVIFQDLRQGMFYQVKLDSEGKAKILSAGPVRHGTPPPGTPGFIPKGGVEVKPEKVAPK